MVQSDDAGAALTGQSARARKPALLEQIIEYLLDKPLAGVTFRTLAKALDVSTFTLVYHFGSRAELVSEIVQEISRRAHEIEVDVPADGSTLETYFDGLERSWEWACRPRSILLQRLEFEAGMLEAQDPSSLTHSRELFARWQGNGRDALIAIGLSAAEAEVESRLTVDSFLGLQYDLVLNRDVDSATAAFRRLRDVSRQRIERLATRP